MEDFVVGREEPQGEGIKRQIREMQESYQGWGPSGRT